MDIKFDNSSIEVIFDSPQEILKNIENHYKNNYSYSTTARWASQVPGDVDCTDTLKKGLETLASLPSEILKKHDNYIFSKKIAQKENEFIEKVIPFYNSYLPDNTDFESTLYLIIFIPAWAFCRDGNAFIDVSSKRWHGCVNSILNIAIHEFYHVGFGKYQAYYDNTDPMANIYWQLQNEGLATYISYKALDLFPLKKLEQDYISLQNFEVVLSKLKRLNEMLQYKKIKSEDIWQIGITERVFYVLGAYMAKILEEKNGKDIIINSIIKGPKYFVETYNSQVEEDLQIICRAI